MIMRYYPVCLDVKGKRCLVVGGGAVGVRKAGTLLDCGAEVIVVSLDFHPAFDTLQKGNTRPLVLKRKAYDPGDLISMSLVIGATDNSDLNRRIGTDAAKQNVLCNLVDLPEKSSFILPAVVSRGDLTLTVSTSGTSPAFAKQLRKDLERQFGNEYGEFLTLMGSIRKQLLAEGHAPDSHRAAFQSLIAGNLLALVAQKDHEAADRLLHDILGPEYSIKELLGGKP
ncbi:MAG: bifunctional precorrin-2 dehydrogenase/sirohydrochlorin ferrochelatase [Pseudomonadota bacterium]